MNRATQKARTKLGRPSIKNKILHWTIELCLMLLTPKAMRPPKAPATAPAEMKKPTRFARSRLVYHKDRWNAMAWPKRDQGQSSRHWKSDLPKVASPMPMNSLHTNRPARLKAPAWHVAPMDQIKAPRAMVCDGLNCLANRVPGT